MGTYVFTMVISSSWIDPLITDHITRMCKPSSSFPFLCGKDSPPCCGRKAVCLVPRPPAPMLGSSGLWAASASPAAALCARRPLHHQRLRKAFLLPKSGTDSARHRPASPGCPVHPSLLYFQSHSCAVTEHSAYVRSIRSRLCAAGVAE